MYKSSSSRFRIVAEPKPDIKNVKINKSSDAVEYIRQFFYEDIAIYESFFIILLNRANTTIGYAKISQGGVAGTVVDSKIIAKYAIESLSSSVILAHNHPSGNLKPSNCDLDLTKKVKNGLNFLDITLADHIILTEDSYSSFNDEGLL